MTDSAVLCIGCKKDMTKYNYGKSKSMVVCSNLCFNWVHHNCIAGWILSTTNFNSIIEKYGKSSTLTEDQFKEIGESISPAMRDIINGTSINCKCPNPQCNGNIIGYKKFNRLDETPRRRWQHNENSKDIFQIFQERQEIWSMSWKSLVKKNINEFVDNLKWRIIPSEDTIKTKWSTHVSLRSYTKNIVEMHRWRIRQGNYYNNNPEELQYYNRGIERLHVAATLLRLHEH